MSWPGTTRCAARSWASPSGLCSGFCAGVRASTAASVQATVALGQRAGAPVRRGGNPELFRLSVLDPCHARRNGFDLHAGLVVPADDRPRLERVCRYALRPPVAEDRVRLTEPGQVRLQLRRRWSEGTSHLLVSLRRKSPNSSYRHEAKEVFAKVQRDKVPRKLHHPYVHAMALVALATEDFDLQRVALQEFLQLQPVGPEGSVIETMVETLRASLQRTYPDIANARGRQL